MFNRAFFAVLLSVGLSNGCGTETTDAAIAAVQDVGLAQAAGVPPLGEGIPPVAGRGGDGAAVVTQVGGWSGGPGAVKWHGGQWVLPYSGRPGDVLQNAACDVVPRADATALVELVSSNGQVLGSATVPATPPTVTIRAWPFVGTHAMGDGEQVVMRISPRALDGTWTDASKDMTVISCSVNGGSETGIRARWISGLSARPMSDGSPTATMTLGRWSFTGTGWMLYALPVKAGESIVGFNWWASKRNVATDLHAELFAIDSTATLTTVGHDVFSHAQTGNVVVAGSGFSIVAAARTTYMLGVQEGASPDGTTAFSDAEVLVQ